MALKIDLTAKTPPALRVVHEPTGSVLRFGFDRIITRAQRASFVRQIGKGRKARETADVGKIFREVKWIDGLDMEGVEEDGVLRDPGLIGRVLNTPEALGGLPEDVVGAVTDYILGISQIDEEDLGN